MGWSLSVVLGVSVTVEVALVSAQQWRGVASHFNRATPFDETVFALMGVMIAFAATVIVVMAIWSFGSVRAPVSLAWAIRLGLVFLVVSQAVGGAMIAQDGNTFGVAGLGKVPHAVTLHAVQLLPALAWALGFADSGERTRLRAVGVAALGYGTLSLVVMLQAFGGRATFDLAPAVAVLLFAGLGLVVAAGGWAVLAIRRHPAAV